MSKKPDKFEGASLDLLMIDEPPKSLKDRTKSKITLKFKGICQSCGKEGIIKIVAGCYYRAYDRKKDWKGKKYSFEIHHIITLNDGGEHAESNLTLVCHKCHKSILHKKTK